MSEQEVESLRREIGEKMARDNEGVPQAHASESLKSGYRRATIGFGSNVQPRQFGKGANEPSAWKCVDGTENPRYRRQCSKCGQRREFVENVG